MDIENTSGYTLKNLNKINIILGKNGCGKSRLLREVDRGISTQTQSYGRSKYITPERGGALTYEPGIEQNLTHDINWLPNDRRKNQTTHFRQQSVAQFRKLETLVLREIEKARRGDSDYTFDLYVQKINDLLDNIQIARHELTFKIYLKNTNQELSADAISSGESELISLGIECLIFNKECVEGKENILFLDEPDVHLHPDLQVRLMHFLSNLTSENSFRVLIATHSTAILGALESFSNTHIAFMTFGQKKIEFKPISEAYRKILPVFGAHPLSNIFNMVPILLVEGDDDERIWQQVVRSSQGRIRLYPCSVDGISNMNSFEQETQQIIKSVYDDAKAYSLRDRDINNDNVEDMPPIIRMKLSCRNAENLLLADEVLLELETNWDQVKESIDKWLDENSQHPHFEIMRKFKADGYLRKESDLKEIRNDLMGIIGSNKPWEVAVGQTIAKLRCDLDSNCNREGKITTYLGTKVVENLLQ